MSDFSPTMNLLYRSLVFAEGVIGRKYDAGQAIVRRGNEVLLVRPRYRPYWEFPGGRVERCEAPESAAIRETKEEARIFITEIERKLGVYSYTKMRRIVHIHVYIAREWKELDLWQPNMEIANRKFFPIDALPDETSLGTLRRIYELRGGERREFAGLWETAVKTV